MNIATVGISKRNKDTDVEGRSISLIIDGLDPAIVAARRTDMYGFSFMVVDAKFAVLNAY